MIVLLHHASHGYTHEAMIGAGDFDLQLLDYGRALHSSRLRRATYLFSDLDRLDPWELELAGRMYRQLTAAGARVLNDPARVRQRFSLLRALKERGINDFDVWRVNDTRRPDRFPVFLRHESAHRGPLSDLLHDERAVQDAVDVALEEGVPARDLLLVEYRAEPAGEGVFRRLGMYRIGERLIAAMCAHDSGWQVKRGELGVAGEDLYEDELDIVTTGRYSEALGPVFEVAEIEYGRADFGIVDGRIQVYEINTNPSIKRLTSHPFPVRLKTAAVAWGNLVEGFQAIDTQAGPWIAVDEEILARQRSYDRRVRGTPWRP